MKKMYVLVRHQEAWILPRVEKTFLRILLGSGVLPQAYHLRAKENNGRQAVSCVSHVSRVYV